MHNGISCLFTNIFMVVEIFSTETSSMGFNGRTLWVSWPKQSIQSRTLSPSSEHRRLRELSHSDWQQPKNLRCYLCDPSAVPLRRPPSLRSDHWDPPLQISYCAIVPSSREDSSLFLHFLQIELLTVINYNRRLFVSICSGGKDHLLTEYWLVLVES